MSRELAWRTVYYMQIKSATGQTRWNGDYNLTITLHPSSAAYTLGIAERY